MIKPQQERRLAALEQQLVPRERLVIITGVPRAPGERRVDNGFFIVVSDESDLEGGAVEQQQDEAVVEEIGIGFGAWEPASDVQEPEPEPVSTPVATPEPEPAPEPPRPPPPVSAPAPVPAQWQPPQAAPWHPPQPAPWPSVVREPSPQRGYRPVVRGQYGWMK